MDIIYIDSKPIFSNDEIHITIKYILKNELISIDKLLFIATFVGQISDEKLFKNTIELLNLHPFLQETADRLIDLDKYFESRSIKDESDKTKLKASIYSISLYYRILLKQFEMFLKNCQIPELKFNVNNRTLEYNLTEITDFVKKKSISSIRNEILDLPKTKDQELEFKKLIQSFELLDYDNSTKYLEKEIKHLESIKNNLTPLDYKTKPNIKHEHIFSNNGFELFEYILEKQVTAKGKKGRFTDISFYYWKMYDDKFIHQRPETFKKWFFETYDKEDIGKMKTLSQCTTEDKKRDKHYSNSLEWFNQYNE